MQRHYLQYWIEQVEVGIYFVWLGLTDDGKPGWLLFWDFKEYEKFDEPKTYCWGLDCKVLWIPDCKYKGFMLGGNPVALGFVT